MENIKKLDVIYMVLEKYIRSGANQAIGRSVKAGRKKYKDKWKEDDWTGMCSLVGVKFSMFMNLVKDCDPNDPVSVSDVRHHYADMIAWLAIVGVRAEMGWTGTARETVIIPYSELQTAVGFIVDEVLEQLEKGKRVIIE